MKRRNTGLDKFREISGRQVNIKDIINGIAKSKRNRKSRKRSGNVLQKPECWMIGNDILRCAKARNNILTWSTYEKDGHYALADIEEAYGSFEKACLGLSIINPDNLEDYESIAADIRRVAAANGGNITAENYREDGIFSFEAIDRKYGFCDILIEEGLMSRRNPYPIYLIKRDPYPLRMISTHTYNKEFRDF